MGERIQMNKCGYCYLRDAKPCYECNLCMGGDNHFKCDPEAKVGLDLSSAKDMTAIRHQDGSIEIV